MNMIASCSADVMTSYLLLSIQFLDQNLIRWKQIPNIPLFVQKDSFSQEIHKHMIYYFFLYTLNAMAWFMIHKWKPMVGYVQLQHTESWLVNSLPSKLNFSFTHVWLRFSPHEVKALPIRINACVRIGKDYMPPISVTQSSLSDLALLCDCVCRNRDKWLCVFSKKDASLEPTFLFRIPPGLP